MDGALKTARYDPEQGHRHGGRGGRGRGGRGGRGRGRGRGNRKFRLPGNIKERPEDVLPGELKLATELLLRVADFSAYSTGEENDLVTNIMTITRPLIQLGDLARLPDDMSKLFIQCLTHLPLQIPVVATVLGLINTTNTYHDFVMLVVNNLSLQLEHSLNEINIPKAKLILRSLACLAACGTVSTDSFVLLLSNIYDSLQLEISENMPMHNVIVLYLLTSTIPWCINTVKQTSNGLEFIQKLNDYCIKHVLSRDANYVSTYSVEGKHAVFFINCLNDGEGEDGDGMSSEAVGDIDVWDTLQRLCMVCREMCSAEAHANTPASPFILDVWKHFSEQLHSTTTFEDVDMLPDVDIDEVTVEDTRTHVIQIDIVATAYAQSSEDESDIRQASLTSSSITEYIRNGIQLHRSDMFYTDVENRERRDRNPCVGSWLSFLYPIFDTTSQDASIASLGQLSHIDRCIVSDYIRDIIVFFEPYIRNDGTYLGSTVTLAQHLLSIHKIYAFNSVTEISSGVEHRVCVTDMNVMQSATECLVVETIFQMLLQIPTYKPLCLHRIILELCRLAPAVIPRLVASACIVLYQLAPAMDTTSWKSITTWLSYQLVNFKLSWPYWDYWATEFNTIDDSNYASEEQKQLIGPQHDTSKAFILDVVDKTSRLSFPTAMKAVLPSSLHVCIPQQDVSNNVANAGSVLLYSCLQMGPVDSASLGAVATTTMELYQKMSTNYSQDDVENWLDEVEIDAPECWKCCALMEIVIFISGGGVILSDISANLDKFTALLRSYSYNVDDGQKVGPTMEY